MPVAVVGRGMLAGRLDGLFVLVLRDGPEDCDVHDIHRHPDVHNAAFDWVCCR
jgi:hypothetical protein